MYTRIFISFHDSFQRKMEDWNGMVNGGLENEMEGNRGTLVADVVSEIVYMKYYH